MRANLEKDAGGASMSDQSPAYHASTSTSAASCMRMRDVLGEHLAFGGKRDVEREGNSQDGGVGREEELGTSRSSSRVLSAFLAQPATPLPSESLSHVRDLLFQVEATVAVGPHGKLDEYLLTVDLLLNLRSIISSPSSSSLSPSPPSDSFRGSSHGPSSSPYRQRPWDPQEQIEKLLRTAMDDLHYEVQLILRHRSLQASAKFTMSRLTQMFHMMFFDSPRPSSSTSSALSPPSSSASSASSSPSLSLPKASSCIYPSFSPPESCTRSLSGPLSCSGRISIPQSLSEDSKVNGEESGRRSRGGEGREAEGPPFPELVPESTARWLNQIVKRMSAAGASDLCKDAYTSVRVESMRQMVESLEIEEIECEQIRSMDWPSLEKLSKRWVRNTYILVGLILGMERQCVHAVFFGCEELRNRVMAEVLISSTFIASISSMLRTVYAIAHRSLPEQLFSTLQMFQVVDEVLLEMDESLGDSEFLEVWAEAEALPLVLARSVASTLDELRRLLEDVPRLATPQKSPALKSKLSTRRLLSFRSKHIPVRSEGEAFSSVPEGGAIDPVTSYVSNYIRGFLSREGKRSYAETLVAVFAQLEKEKGMFSNRNLEKETVKLVGALHKNLHLRSLLYPDPLLQKLFLLNNINYLFVSMSQWDGWHSRGLLHALSCARREGANDLLLIIHGIRENRWVYVYEEEFLTAALGKVLSPLVEGGQEASFLLSKSSSVHGLSAMDSTADLSSSRVDILRLKRFNAAFEELLSQQRMWSVPDEDLRRHIRTTWAATIKERYIKMLTPHWDDLTTSKAFMYTPEKIEMLIQDTFFQHSNE